MWYFLPLLGCASAPEPDPPAKAKKRQGEALLVDWAPLPADLAAADLAHLATATAAAAARAPQPPAPTGGDDVLVIVLDTVRADHLGVYGYAEGTTPRLDAWANGARVWDQAWTDAPWTLPAHASMFTGKPQREHGARSVPKDDPRKGAALPDAQVTFAERLRDAGWRTVGVSGNLAFLHPTYGLGQGFDVWINDQPGADPRKVPYLAADRVVPLAEAAMAVADPRPLLLFVNLMDAHRPYKARRGYVKHPDRLRAGLPGNKGYQKLAKKLLSGAPLDPDVQASWVQAYDAELRFLDEHLGRLLASAEGRFEHVFVLADHGEYLGEHGLVEHAKDVYEEVLHVPFVVKSPRWPAGRDASFVQAHDLGGMVLDAVGLDNSGFQRTGDTMVADLYWTLKKDLTAPYGARFDRIRRAFRVGPHKVIYGSDGSREAFDLGADPAESRPLADLPAALLGVEDAWLAAHPEVPLEAPGGALGPDEALLKALGYAE